MRFFEVLSMLNETSVKCFLSVAKHQSFTKSAEDLFLSRQAVNKQILSLEEQLGVKLFYRHKNLIELTDEGKLYLDFFKNTARELEELRQTIQKNKSPSEQVLIGYTIGMFFDQRILDVLAEYTLNNTNIIPQICRHEPGDIEQKLLNEELAMAFNVIPQGGAVQEGLSCIIMEHFDNVLAVSRKHPKVNENTKLSDFDGEKAVYWNLDGSPDHVCRKNFYAFWKDIEITLFPTQLCTTLSCAYSDLLFSNAVLLCSANNEICAFPDIITYSLSKKQNFGCMWRNNASSSTLELAELFRKYEIEPL